MLSFMVDCNLVAGYYQSLYIPTNASVPTHGTLECTGVLKRKKRKRENRRKRCWWRKRKEELVRRGGSGGRGARGGRRRSIPSR